MRTHSPGLWVLLKNNKLSTFKILGAWRGGYLDSEAWRLSSNIVQITEEDNYMLFYGESGSMYRCRKSSVGLSALSASILNEIQDEATSVEIVQIQDIKVLIKELQKTADK